MWMSCHCIHLDKQILGALQCWLESKENWLCSWTIHHTYYIVVKVPNTSHIVNVTKCFPDELILHSIECLLACMLSNECYPNIKCKAVQKHIRDENDLV